MKLYTEEQVREVFDLVKLSIWGTNVYTKDELIGKLTPIELPSDEEIENESSITYREFPSNPKENPDWTYNRDIHVHKKRKAFYKGVKWVINQIKQQYDGN